MRRLDTIYIKIVTKKKKIIHYYQIITIIQIFYQIIIQIYILFLHASLNFDIVSHYLNIY